MVKILRKSSENAKAVAREVVDSVRKGEKIVLGKIIKRHGYSDSISKQPSRVIRTRSYQEAVSDMTEKMQAEVFLMFDCMEVRRSGAKYRDLVDGVEKMVKAVSLLKQTLPTEREEYKPTEEELQMMREIIDMNHK